jgi:hypothetical protein
VCFAQGSYVLVFLPVSVPHGPDDAHFPYSASALVLEFAGRIAVGLGQQHNLSGSGFHIVPLHSFGPGLL